MAKKTSLFGTVKSPEDLAAVTDDLIKNPPKELTERQRRIVNYRLRGMTQVAIATLEKVSQPMIAKELRKIREVYKEQGRAVETDQVLGETVSLYQEIERRGWELFFLHKEDKPNAANKALDTIMSSRERTLKLMMDLGIMKKAAKEVEHKINMAPFVQQFDSMSVEQKQEALSNVITVSLEELAEPEPPQLPPEVVMGELEEPEPPEEDTYDGEDT